MLALGLRGEEAVLGKSAQKVLFHLGGAGRRTVIPIIIIIFLCIIIIRMLALGLRGEEAVFWEGAEKVLFHLGRGAAELSSIINYHHVSSGFSVSSA